MSLTQAEAVRILRFCLGPDDSGSAAVMADGACVVSVVPCQASFEARTFEGASFEQALRRAARGGSLKLECVEKQIGFFARRDSEGGPFESDVAGGSSPAPAGGLRADWESPDEGTSSFLKLVQGIHELLHETQHERGISTLFAASRGRLMADELSAQWRRTDLQLGALAGVLRSLERPPTAVLRRLARARALLRRLERNRAELADQVVTAQQIIDGYSAINSELLAALDAYMISGAIGAQRSGALACLALLYAKEKTGVERAQLADVFFADRFSEGQRVAAAMAIAGKANYLHIFSAAAPRAAERLLRRILDSPAVTEVERLEKVVFSSSETGFGIDASRWFETISLTIDLLGDISSSVIALLRGGR